MKICKPFVTVLFLLIYSVSGYAQSNANCPNNAEHPKNDSEELLTDYLNSDNFQSVQPVFNLPDLQSTPIELLTGSSESCLELNNESQNYINVGPNEDYTYYKVSNYYFVVDWHSVNIIGTRNIIIYDNQYNVIFEELL